MTKTKTKTMTRKISYKISPLLLVTLDKKAIALKGTKAIRYLFSAFQRTEYIIQYVIYFFVVE